MLKMKWKGSKSGLPDCVTSIENAPRGMWLALRQKHKHAAEVRPTRRKVEPRIGHAWKAAWKPAVVDQVNTEPRLALKSMRALVSVAELRRVKLSAEVRCNCPNGWVKMVGEEFLLKPAKRCSSVAALAGSSKGPARRENKG